MHHIAVLGSSGAIGRAVILQLSANFPDARIYAFSRQPQQDLPSSVQSISIDYTNEDSIKQAAQVLQEGEVFSMVFVATGLLHAEGMMPEKSLQDLTGDNMLASYQANTVFPALVAKYFSPKLDSKSRSWFAVLSARVGSITDNRLGGWTSYRAAKAALNMVIKNASIEIGRFNKQAVVVGLHPGTVDSALSKPFQANVPKEKLFTPDFAATQLLKVLKGLKPESGGACYAWDGTRIDP